MAAKQNHLCAICGNPEREGTKLSIDHCHTTDKIRELLCTNCNIGIGKGEDNPAILLAAAAYLREHTNTTTNHQAA
jgi:hypothetical protein